MIHHDSMVVFRRYGGWPAHGWAPPSHKWFEWYCKYLSSHGHLRSKSGFKAASGLKLPKVFCSLEWSLVSRGQWFCEHFISWWFSQIFYKGWPSASWAVMPAAWERWSTVPGAGWRDSEFKWGFPYMGGSHKMDGLFHGTSYENGWFGGTPILGNPHM